MTAHDPAFSAHPNPGGATVADLRSMGGAEALAVMLFRDSFEGPPGTARLRAVFADALGPAAGAAAFDDWSELLHRLMRDARRPLMRHGLACACVGADEAALALVLRLAATGEREDALMTLSLLIPGDRVLPAFLAAERAGRAVLAAVRIYERGRPAGPSRHLH